MSAAFLRNNLVEERNGVKVHELGRMFAATKTTFGTLGDGIVLQNGD
jgi:hypothetical protein